MPDAHSSADHLAARAYALATGDDDARACLDIPEAQCREQPRNFGLTLLALTATKAGDELSSARLVLAWVMTAVGAPAGLLALLVPIRESGALLPQLLIAAWIRQAPIRKWFWIGGNLVQGSCLVGMALVALNFEGALAGGLIIALLVGFSLARGVCSVAIKDVMGKTIDKGRRGSLSGWATSSAGLAAILAGAVLAVLPQDDLRPLAGLLIGAGALWFLAAWIYAGVSEQPGATQGGRNAGREALRSLSLLRDDADFRRFVVVRALLLSTALAFPFYAALAQLRSGSEALLGLLVASAGLAGLLAAPIWGRWSDHSSRQVMAAAAALAGVTGLLTAGLEAADLLGQAGGWIFALLFFAMAVAHHGVRVARTTYLLDLGTTQTRAAYTAVSNTVIGLLMLATGSIGLLASTLGSAGVIGILSVLALVAAVACLRLRPV